MRRIVVVAAVALASCSGAGKKAEQAYNLARQSGSASDRCDAAAKVAAAYQQEGDAQNYETWRGTQTDECRTARLAQGSAAGDMTPAEQAQDDKAFNDLQAELKGK